jgi:hypothetical protein
MMHAKDEVFHVHGRVPTGLGQQPTLTGLREILEELILRVNCSASQLVPKNILA